MSLIWRFLGAYRNVTNRGKLTTRESIATLGFKYDEKLYVRPIYERDEARLPTILVPGHHRSHCVVDGNHRLDWMLEHVNDPQAHKTAQVTHFKGKVCARSCCIQSLMCIGQQ